VAPAANAASYNIAFDDKLNGVGNDFFGDFTTNASNVLTAFNVTISGVTYNTLPTLFGLIGPPTLDLGTMTLSGPLLDTAVVTGNLGLLLMNDEGKWGSGGCSNPLQISTCIATIALDKGTYKISEVPVPAALPLFATGVAAVAWAGRRKRKAAEANA
jgi:hypothetical protein